MKKGFTLIELLAVIAILALISVITIPLVTKTINNSKESTEKRQIESIEQASENWFIKQKYSLSDNSKSFVVMLQTIIDDGYLDKTDVTNPNSGDTMNGCVRITYQQNQYQYKYSENDCNCIDSCTIIPEETVNNG